MKYPATSRGPSHRRQIAARAGLDQGRTYTRLYQLQDQGRAEYDEVKKVYVILD